MNRLRWEPTSGTGERRPEAPAAVPAAPQPLLQDQRLRAPQMAVVRASLARSLQAGVGNRAVGAMLMRDPAAAPPPPAPVVGHQTGKAVDDALSASPYFAKLVEARFTAGTKVDGHVHVEPEAVFEAAYVKMATARIRPSTGEPYSEEAARKAAKTAAAFEDGGGDPRQRDRRRSGHGGPRVDAHVLRRVRTDTAKDASEGVTEHFAKTLCTEMGLARGVHYPEQLARWRG